MKKSSKTDGPCWMSKLSNYICSFVRYIPGFSKNKRNTLSLIKEMVQKSQDINHNAQLILSNGLKFIEKDVEDVIIPRSDIFGIPSTATIDDINKALLETSHTRILVYKENLDDIIGFIHVKDLYKKMVLGKLDSISDIIRKPITVAPSTKLIHLLSLMQQERIHLAVIVDEYGGTAGIVTNEDVIEALVGAINDEHDGSNDDKEESRLIDSRTLIASARLKIEKVEELLKIDLKEYENECETIGGLIISKAGKVPQVGNILNINDNIKVEILSANKRVLKKIKIKNIAK
jgi:CBS domain containing-hemolysin-like protein